MPEPPDPTVPQQNPRPLPVAFAPEQSFHPKSKIQNAYADSGQPVPVAHFDFSALDTLEDHLREALARGQSLAPIVHSLVEEQLMEVRCETVNAVVALVINHDRKGQAIYALAEAAGLAITQGLSQQEIADKAGCSKQNIQELSEQFRRILRLRKTRTQRDDTARTRMSLANFRRPGKKHAAHAGRAENKQ